jgi:hypothetical protein
MNADAFLTAHQWGELAVFDLASRLTTISIRDQMVRARMLADRLPRWLEQRDGVRFRDGRILVVGGGACGLTAAVALAEQKLKVDVVERQPEPFHVQASCTSRWVDPTQYDWPMDHWRRASFPWPPTPRSRFPFPWSANFAAQTVAKQWIPLLDNHSASLQGILRLDYGLLAGQPRPRPSGRLEVEFFEVASKQSLGFDEFTAVVLAFGFGAERCNLDGSPHFRGFPFWESDTFEANGCGVAGGQGQDTVLISGSGDGSLQDLLRIVTRERSARRVYDMLGLGALGIDLTAIFSAELRTERALTWSEGRDFAAPYARELHQVHLQTVQTLLQNHAGLPALIHNLAARRPARTILVNRTDYFTCNYGLNRFLALLLFEAIQDGTLLVHSNQEVQQIFSSAPPVPTSPAASHGRSWRVVLGHPQTHGFTAVLDVNVIILRHGIDPPEVSLAAREQQRNLPRPAPPIHLH